MSTTTKTRQNKLLALDASQATISTATVTINTLRVNNKQLTQATFRQLPKRELINVNGLEVLGAVWGWVNYTPSGEPEKFTQFVAQFGAELCRCPVKVYCIHPAIPEDWRRHEDALSAIVARELGLGDRCLSWDDWRKLGVNRLLEIFDHWEPDHYAAKWNNLMGRLKAAPQLFIAV